MSASPFRAETELHPPDFGRARLYGLLPNRSVVKRVVYVGPRVEHVGQWAYRQGLGSVMG